MGNTKHQAPSTSVRSKTARRSRLGTVARIVSNRSQSATAGSNNSCNRLGPGKPQRRAWRRKRIEKTPEQLGAARVRRWSLQATAGAILPNERVAKCLRERVPVAPHVGVAFVPATHSANYRNLQCCSSVWSCPMCASLISERRREELARLVKAHTETGGGVYMTTYTIRHKRYDELLPLQRRFLAARRRAKQGRRGVALRDDHGIIGTVSVLEVTWSERNGWHPHVHELVFTSGEINEDQFEQEARAAWEDAAAKEGLDMNEHGFKLQRTYGAVADYIAKYGREPALDNPWGIEAEMTKGHLKQGRGPEDQPGMTPFQILAAIHDEGRDELRPVFYEYAQAFKGRKQLNYSKGLKALYEEEEKSDEEVMQEHEHEALDLVELRDEQWAGVLGNDIRGELLEEARTGSPGRVLDYLADFGIPVYEEQYTRLEGWEVKTAEGAATVTRVTRCPLLKRWRCAVELAQPGEDGATWRAFDLAEVVAVAPPPAAESLEEVEEATYANEV
jgi:hypothetical protein